jgi:GNAT superfamily N-acetyltransferase
MNPSITIEELIIPATLDAPDAADFLIANDLRNLIAAEGLGPAAGNNTPAETMASMQDQRYERKQWFLARQDGEILAYTLSHWSVEPTTQITWLDVAVHPSWRGQGIGTTMLEFAEALARDSGRPIVQGGAMHLPVGGPRLESPTGFGSIPREEPTARFLLRHGYTLEQVYRYSKLDLPVAPDVLAAHRREAEAKAGPDYRAHVWTGPTPERWLDDIAVLNARMATDAPTGGMEIEEEAWDAERVRAQEARAARADRQDVVAAVEHIPTGRLVAFNGVSVPGHRSRPVQQGPTLVLKEHRGHRLGMLVKIANIQQLATVSPESSLIITDNAEENRPMLNVNEAVGFRAIGYEGAWKKTIS